MIINFDQKIPIKIWLPNIAEIEEQALQQIKNTARLPFVFKHIAIMPDVHYGKGATIGSVIATKGAICPAAVGVDICCGMMAVKLDINREVIRDKIDIIRQSIERSVPVGFQSNKTITKTVEEWSGWEQFKNVSKTKKSLENIAKAQLGSLGGGNHFIELCEDQDNNIWVMLHSGSRNIGKTLAEYHIDKAKEDMKAFFIDLPDPDLAYFVESKSEFHEYVKDLEWLSSYAFANRSEMMCRILKDISFSIGDGSTLKKIMEVNCHHNYVSRENHFGQNVLITRKGAVRAREEDYGIIPGSMGTKSYIVKGKGNLQSFCSCSHGAGRRMSRSEARRQFTTEDLFYQTLGVECRKDKEVIDEIPGAYKDIDMVMQNQADLVEVIATLKQFMCIKG